MSDYKLYVESLFLFIYLFNIWIKQIHILPILECT